MSAILPVILCGGSGTRLWPLSRKSLPKQFVPLVGGKSLLQQTLERVSRLSTEVLLVAAEEHRFLAAEAMEAAAVAGSLILEPQPRNTAAAMALAALQASHTDPTQLLLFCPADHFVPDSIAFAETIRAGMAAAQVGSLVTFGVTPSFPSTAYGYIRVGAERPDGTHRVERFIEKPDVVAAERLLFEGGVLWNAGIFLCRADALLAALAQHAPDILESCKHAVEQGSQDTAPGGQIFIRPAEQMFSSCRAQSIDYAVMEKHADVAVAAFRGAWSDVGSWNAVADLSAADAQGNRLHGHGIAHHATHTYIHAPHRPVVALGTQDLLIVDTPDALLVAHRDMAEQVKDVVGRLADADLPQASAHRRVARPWGWYDSIDAGPGFQVKRIGVKPGAALSLQKHHQRAEHWVVVRGLAEVTRGSEVFRLERNESTYIPIGEVHRLRNAGETELEIIEVQSGDYLGEDDIVRLEDHYGRK